jgi:tetratricopeptide (TPR) repeat protein
MGRGTKTFLTTLSLIGLVINLFLLMALYNFIPWEGLLIGLGIFLIFILSRIVRPNENWVWLPMVSFVVIMGILMIGSVNISKINLPIEVSPSFKISAEVAKGVNKDNFFLGSGPGTYGYDFSLYRPVDFNNNYFYNLRFYQGTGVIAEGIATAGVLGIVAALLLLATYLSVSFYYLSREKQKNKIFSLGLFSSSMMILFCALMSPFGGTMLIWGGSLVALSLAVLFFESEAKDKAWVLSLKASPRYALALAFVFMIIAVSVIYAFVFLGKTFIADLYAGAAARQEQPSEDGSITKLIKAVNLYPKEGRYYTRIGQEYMLLANNEMAKSEQDRDTNKIKNYLGNAIMSGVQGKALMPNDVLAVESLGQLYENSGAYVENSLNLAQDAYKEAQKLEPHNPNYFLELGNLKMIQASVSKDENEKKKLVGEECCGAS